MKAASTKAAASVEAAAAEAAAMTATTSTATSQRHCWRNQANRCNCQQRNNRLAQHNHSPSEIATQPRRFLQVVIVRGNRERR
jgi:hypothetical protein